MFGLDPKFTVQTDNDNGNDDNEITPLLRLSFSFSFVFVFVFFFFSFHGGEVFRLSTPGSFAPPFRSHSGPPQNYPRHGYPSHPRSNQSTPLSSRDYNDPRRNNYDRNQAPRDNSGGYQGNRPTAWSHILPSYRGPGSSQPQFSRSNYHNQSRDSRQHQDNRHHGPPGRVSIIACTTDIIWITQVQSQL